MEKLWCQSLKSIVYATDCPGLLGVFRKTLYVEVALESYKREYYNSHMLCYQHFPTVPKRYSHYNPIRTSWGPLEQKINLRERKCKRQNCELTKELEKANPWGPFFFYRFSAKFVKYSEFFDLWTWKLDWTRNISSLSAANYGNTMEISWYYNIALFNRKKKNAFTHRAPANLKFAGNWPKVAAMCVLQSYLK